MTDPRLGQLVFSALGLLLLLKAEGLDVANVSITILESAVARGAGEGLDLGNALTVTSFPSLEGCLEFSLFEQILCLNLDSLQFVWTAAPQLTTSIEDLGRASIVGWYIYRLVSLHKNRCFPRFFLTKLLNYCMRGCKECFSIFWNYHLH